MRAMVIDRFGKSDELHLADVERPEPGPEQLLLRMAYASVNPADWKSRAGLLPPMNRYAFPITVGFDGSGVVEAVGPGVTDFQVGDRVITLSGYSSGLQGTYADYCVVPVRRTTRLPDHLSFAEGATIPCAAASAASTIVEVAKVKQGDRVFLNGGSGSVGTFGIQFLRYLGCTVAATCSGRNVDYVKGLGADLVIDYTRDDILAALRDWAPDGVDVVIDAVGQHSLPPETVDVIRPGGTLVCITNLLTGTEAFDLASAEKRGVTVLDNVTEARRPDPRDFQVDAFLALMEGVKARAIQPAPYEILPLDQAGPAHDRVEDGHVRGKLLLEIGGELS